MIRNWRKLLPDLESYQQYVKPSNGKLLAARITVSKLELAGSLASKSRGAEFKVINWLFCCKVWAFLIEDKK